MLKELILKNRSYRRFYQDEQIPLSVLRKSIDLASLTPSAANKQPLKYLIITDPHVNNSVFTTLTWAGYLSDWDGPEEGKDLRRILLFSVILIYRRNIMQIRGLSCRQYF